MLSIKNLYCKYNKKDIIRNMSFDLKENENLCIIGPNGCGKTTLLKAIAGLIEYSGEVILNEEDLKRLDRKSIAKNIAIVNQNTKIFFPYTVYEAVSFGRYPYKKGIFDGIKKEEEEFILHCIEKVDLLDEKDKMINCLSGGQIQRVFLARAFAQNPRVLLLDEPTNHLDLKNQINLLEYINEWKNGKDKAVISVLHDLNLVQNFGEKVVLINNGKIILDGYPKEVLNKDEITEIYGVNIKKFMINSLSKWEGL